MRPANDTMSTIERLRAVLDNDPRIAYALLFGSRATGKAYAHSDLDVAIGLAGGCRLNTTELGALTSGLETAAGRPVDLLLLNEASPGLAYRVFRDGRPIVSRDAAALSHRRARAILDYLDFRPIEDLCTRGALAARHGR